MTPTFLRSSVVFAAALAMFSVAQADKSAVAGHDPSSNSSSPKLIGQIGGGQRLVNKLTISTDFDGVHGLAWSPDSKYFAVIGIKGGGNGYDANHFIQVYEANTQRIIRTLTVKKSGSQLGDVAFSPDGKYLAGGTGVITLWETNTWQPVRDILGPYERGIYVSTGFSSVAFSPDGKEIAVFYSDVTWPETIKINTWEEGAKLANDKTIKSLGTIMVFDVETADRLFSVKGIERTSDLGGFFSGNLVYSPNGQYLLSSRLESHKLIAGEHYKYYTFLEFRDPKTGKIIKEISDIHTTRLTAMAASPDGRYIATGTETTSKESTQNPYTNGWDLIDNKDPIKLWDVSSGKVVMNFGPLRGAVRALAFSPDNRTLVSCQTDIENKETIWLWDVASGQLIERVTTPKSGSEFFSCAMSPNGRYIAMPVVKQIYLLSIGGSL